MVFENLEQRIAHGYMEMLPSFVPDKSAPVSVPEQKKFYEIIKKLYQLAFDEPLLFVTKLHEDDAYPHRFMKPYGKPKLIIDINKFRKSIDNLLHNMMILGQGSDVKINKRQQEILSRLGIDDYANLPAALIWMSKREGTNISIFSHCLFNKNYSYTSEIYNRLLGSSFKKLEDWMLSQGYKRYDIYNTTASDCNLSLAIANPKWSDEPPRGGFEYKIRHTGISALFTAHVKNPVLFGLCIPNGMKTYLEAFDSMDDELKNFVIEKTKKCDNCKYCIQTDKTGKRPKAFVTVKHNDKKYNLCAYFPGYTYCWTSIDDNLADKLIEMLSFMDGFARKLK